MPTNDDRRRNKSGRKRVKLNSENENENSIGYSIRTRIIAIFNKTEERICTILDKKISNNGYIKYYVHWEDFNRRMDEWIKDKTIVRICTEEENKEFYVKDQKEKDKKANSLLHSTTTSTISSDTNLNNSKHFDLDEQSITNSENDKGIRTRGQKQKKKNTNGLTDLTYDLTVDDKPEEHDEHEGMDEASIREHEEVTRVKNIDKVEIGPYRMNCWYFSPFPKEYFPDGNISCLYFCEFCMSFFRYKKELSRHQERKTCPRHPPGNEIYRHENISVFEVDGYVSKPYCQNLCYFAKLFLDHKTLYYDVDPFLFYVICEIDNRGFHPVGYFSKEKYSELGYNLACILTFPCHQRKGIGNFIIQFSYELSKKEGKVGSPEKPLSDLGLISYRSYWTKVILNILKIYPHKDISIMDLTQMTSIKTEDIINTLQSLHIIQYINGSFIFVLSPEVIDEQLLKVTRKGPIVLPEKLHWTPLHLDIKNDKWSLKSKLPSCTPTQEE